jgi:hypothetical protein
VDCSERGTKKILPDASGARRERADSLTAGAFGHRLTADRCENDDNAKDALVGSTMDLDAFLTRLRGVDVDTVVKRNRPNQEDVSNRLEATGVGRHAGEVAPGMCAGRLAGKLP